MLSADFVFTVIFIVLIPLALICSACVVADTVLAYIRHHEERCWNCMRAQTMQEPEPEAEPEPEKTEDELEEIWETAKFGQNDQNNCLLT